MKKAQKIFLIIIVLLVVIIALLPGYTRNSLIYWYANIDDYTIFENHVVSAYYPEPWKKHEDYNNFALSDSALQKMAELETVGFLVIKDDKLYFEEYWDDYSENSLSNSFSMAKSIISMLVGIAIDQGKIRSVDDKIADYIEEYDTEQNRNLTIKDLLTMSSGLNWDESYGSPFSMTTAAYYGDDIEDLVLNMDVVEEPGQIFKYKSGNTLLLGLLLKKVTGTSVAEYAAQNLWGKIGAENDALWSVDHEGGLEKAYCCFNSNARDFARLGQLYLDKGKWNRKRVISKKYIKESITPAVYLEDEQGKTVDYYGYQWWILNYKGKQYPYMRGILGQYVILIPEEDMVVVRLGRKRMDKTDNIHPDCVRLYIDAALQLKQ